jgi:alpha-galactosidase
MKDRGEDGRLQPNPLKFPSGMKALGDYIHSRGLKFGIYSDAGNKTCEGYVASWGHEVLVSALPSEVLQEPTVL